MSEMLANHYFQNRKFITAAPLLEKALKYSNDDSLKKKLIICYAETGRISEAFNLFCSLIKTNIKIILDTNTADEDCPCPDLIFQMENPFYSNDLDFINLLQLGMLWLFCDKETSLNYFQKALTIQSNNKEIIDTISIIKKHNQSQMLSH